jgi:hypothetical protein
VFIVSTIGNEIALSAFARPDVNKGFRFQPSLPLDLFALDNKGKNVVLTNICNANFHSMQRSAASRVKAMETEIRNLLRIEENNVVQSAVVTSSPRSNIGSVTVDAMGLGCLMSGWLKMNAKRRFCVCNSKALSVYDKVYMFSFFFFLMFCLKGGRCAFGPQSDDDKV